MYDVETRCTIYSSQHNEGKRGTNEKKKNYIYSLLKKSTASITAVFAICMHQQKKHAQQRMFTNMYSVELQVCSY